MRRHRLIDRGAGVASAMVMGVLLLGSTVAASARPDASEPAVTIRTAPGGGLSFAPKVTLLGAPGTVDLVFRNASTVAHNLVFVGGVSAQTRTIVEPGATDALSVDFDAPGTYSFVCTIHDGMTGEVVVDPAALD